MRRPNPAGRQPLSDLVVVIPGIMGSILSHEDGTELWTIRGRKLLPMVARFVAGRSRLELKSDVGRGSANDGVEPTGLLTDLHAIPGLWTINGYERLITWLTSRFEVDEVDAQGEPGNLLRFPYDWRLSNRHSGKRLAEAIDVRLAAWRKRSGSKDAQVTLVCHSMGGLVARWFLDVEGGASVCRRLITIGTPYQGAPAAIAAIAAIANGVHKGLGPIWADLTALVRSFPSVWELLAIYPCVDPGNGVLARVNDVDVPNLTAAETEWSRQFHAELAAAAPAFGEAEYQTVALKGHLQPTAQVVRVKDTGVQLDDLEEYCDKPSPYSRPVGRDGKVEPLLNVRGDGTVPRGSSHPAHWKGEVDAAGGDKVQGFVPKHADLQNSDRLHEILYQVLTADRLGQTAGGHAIAVSTPEMVCSGEPVLVEVQAGTAADRLMLEVRVDGAQTPAVYLGNAGGGRYTGDVPGLPIDVHELEVTATEGGIPVESVSTLVTVANDEHLLKLVSREMEATRRYGSDPRR